MKDTDRIIHDPTTPEEVLEFERNMEIYTQRKSGGKRHWFGFYRQLYIRGQRYNIKPYVYDMERSQKKSGNFF